MIKTRGKLIVIDGIDGAGKTTQTDLLREYMKVNSVPAHHIKFPRYNSFYGNTAAKFLRGELGSFDEVSPYLASLIFAMDRSSAKEEIAGYLNSGIHIITDRYATSNMAHQGSKFSDERARKEFLDWVFELEYVQEKIPKEDIVLFLDMPAWIARDLLSSQIEKSYLKGKKDIHEERVTHLEKTREEFLKLNRAHKHWIKIKCTDSRGKLLTIQDIHEESLGALRQSIEGI